MTTLFDQSASNDDVGSERAQEFAREHPRLVQLGRVGWAANGVVYALMGALAFTIAGQSAGTTTGQGEEASKSGAIATIAEQPAGAALLIAIAIGLALYAIWKLVSLVLPADNDAHAWVSRLGSLLGAVSYVALGWTALSIALRPGTSDGSNGSRVETYTRRVLDATGGRFLIFAIGLGVVGLGGYYLYKAWNATFESDLAPGSVGPLSHHALVNMGRVGWLGRGLMVALIGSFLTRAAMQFDPDDAVGLDGALRRVAGSPLGTALVAVVALGLIAYGVFCIVSAPRRRLTSV
ncbi:MAG: DUF1206 domain-containing protein [Acidimicrobiales bacterium]